jgi:hypothetical protein
LQAEKTVKSASGFLGNLFGGASDKIEDAADKFSRAGNAFKAAKKCACAWGRACGRGAHRRRYEAARGTWL